MLEGRHSYDASCTQCPPGKFQATVAGGDEGSALENALAAHPRPKHGAGAITLRHSPGCLCQARKRPIEPSSPV
jgi:hypothetical protein